MGGREEDILYRNAVAKIASWLTIIFLIGSAYVQINKSNFDWQALFGTDGLTLFGILAALISLLGPKIPLIRRFISWCLLSINYSQIDYGFMIYMESQKVLPISDLRSVFEKSITSAGLNIENYDINNLTDTHFRIYHRELATNISIKSVPNAEFTIGTTLSEDRKHNLWEIKVDGVSTFRIFERNWRFLNNYFLESLLNSGLRIDRINLKIASSTTEINLGDKGILLDTQKYKILNSRIEIACPDDARILLEKGGIYLLANSRGEFNNALDTVKNILLG